MRHPVPTAVAANMCPHCHETMGHPHKVGCLDFGGQVGIPPVVPRQLFTAPVPATHKKTGNPYLYLRWVLNLTTGLTGQTLALYASECMTDVPLFVRELHEFWERFEPAARPPLTQLDTHLGGLRSDPVRSKISGQHYRYLGDVLDCTNSRDDVLMALFVDDSRSGSPWFVCDKDEFLSRFEPVLTVSAGG